MSAIGDQGEAGETLIEALVVVALTSLVALIGFPRLQQSLQVFSQHETVSIVAAQLRQTRAEAIRKDQPAIFAISPDGKGYATSGGAVSATPPGVSLQSRSAPGMTGGAIAFFGDGSSTGGAVWVSAGGRSLPIYVAPATGAVSGAGG